MSVQYVCLCNTEVIKDMEITNGSVVIIGEYRGEKLKQYAAQVFVLADNSAGETMFGDWILKTRLVLPDFKINQ